MTALQHYLRPLLAPASVALVGASDKPASLGRIVFENLLEGGFKGDLYAVNPNHRRLLGRRCFASLAAIGKPVELALIAVPCAAVTGVLDDAAHCGVKAAVILSAPPLDDGDARRWQRDVLATAKKRRIRLLGPHAFGVIRTSIGLNATMGAGLALPGRLALIAQSGAVCTAMLNFASPNGIGFSTVVAIGGAYDIGFGELLDALVNDPQTDGILVYVEKVSDARRFLSALRAAARTKPVVVLRAGRSSELQHGGIDADAPPPDAVFDAAMRRAGTVRVRSYAQLFAAARILSMGKLPRGDHLAIVTNGHGPGTMAADSAADRGVPLAVLSAQTEKKLAALLPANVAIRNPVNVRGDATPERMAAAVSATLADPQVDAVLALHVQRPATGATDVARAVAEVARTASKPVLGAWLGAIGRREVRDALEAGGVPDFYTPEHAVEAFSFLAAYRHNQKWLLEVPAPQPEPEPPDTTEAERVREEAGAANHTVLTDWQTQRLLRAFGLPVEVAVPADTLKEALAAARRLGYPVALKLDISGLRPRAPVSPDSLVRANLRNGRALTKAYGDLLEDMQAHFRPGDFAARVLVVKAQPMPDAREVAIGVHTDAVFGPVITFGNSGTAALIDSERTVLLPPLNHRLATDLISGSRTAAALRASHDAPPDLEPLVQILLQVSSLVCALPWVSSISLDPVRVGSRRRGDRRSAREDRSEAQVRHRRLPPHGDPPVPDRARRRRSAARRHGAARPADHAGGCRARARVRPRPVRADPLLPLLLPAARADAGDARALHPGRLRPRARAGGDRRQRGDAGVRRRRPLHRQPGPGERRVRRGRRRCLAEPRRRADADGAPDRLRQEAGPEAARGRGAARQHRT